MIKTFIKKPVTVQAIQLTSDNWEEVADFVGKDVRFALDSFGKPYLIINTLEGANNAFVGDWIICGVKGEFYPCKPDIFELIYDEKDPEKEEMRGY